MSVSISYRPPLSQAELDSITQDVLSQIGPSASGTNTTTPTFNVTGGGSQVITTTFNSIHDVEVFQNGELITDSVDIVTANISGASTVTVSSNQNLTNLILRINGN
jgi:hypothetical protein